MSPLKALKALAKAELVRRCANGLRAVREGRKG